MTNPVSAGPAAIIRSGAHLEISRRRLIGSLACTAGLALPMGAACAVQGDPVFTPEQFGARGDGAADDYPALLRLAAAVSRAGGGVVRFGRRKRYRIAQIQVSRVRGGDTAAHISFERCRGLLVDLNESTIDVRGDFHRRSRSARASESDYNAIVPFRFHKCADLTVRNGNLNGNAQRMTRDREVGERGGHGIMLVGCDRVVLEDLHIHHFSTDGVYLKGDADMHACHDVRLERVRLTNNARQGLTNAGGAAIIATDCAFNENGRTGGSYYHAPGAGVDVEPMRRYDRLSDFKAIGCRFDENLGSPVVAGNPDLSASVELLNCGGRRSEQRRLNLAARRVVVRGGEWHNIQIACGYGVSSRVRSRFSVEVSNAVWTGDDPAWSPIYDVSAHDPDVHIHGNRFALRPRSALGRTYPFQCANPNHRFEQNQIFVARSGHDGEGDDLIAQFAGAVVRGNRWSTDLRAPLRFVNNYQGAREASQEQFEGSFAGMGLRG